MIKTLLKKQLLEGFAGFTLDKKGNRRKGKSLVGFGLLMLVGVASIFYLFYAMGELLCAPLLMQGLDWLYFAFMGTIATAFGVIGSIFMAKSKLYEAKDNDLLFSMPIPAWTVLFVRTVGVYLFTLLFEALVFLPALVSYFVTAGFSLPVCIGGLLTLAIMPFGGTAICLLLGWALAVIAAKLPAKNLFTTLFTIAFVIGYMVVYSNLNEYLSYVVTHGGQVAGKMKSILYPFAKLGLATTGDILSLAIYLLIFGGLFALTYFLLSKTYLRLITANRGAKKAKYKSKAGKQGTPFLALFKKEALRYLKNPMIAMNCFLGTIFCVLSPLLLIAGKELIVTLRAANVDEVVALILAVMFGAIVSMNMVSASSVSLEGENIWITRSMPVKTERVLLVKAALHFLSVGIPLLIPCVVFSVALRIRFWLAFVMTASALAFATLTAVLGLIVNLKLPNLHWTSELVAVKQSMSAVISMFAEWGMVALLVGGWFLFGKYLFTGGYFLVCIALLAAVVGLLVWWIVKRGKRIFEEL